MFSLESLHCRLYLAWSPGEQRGLQWSHRAPALLQAWSRAGDMLDGMSEAKYNSLQSQTHM